SIRADRIGQHNRLNINLGEIRTVRVIQQMKQLVCNECMTSLPRIVTIQRVEAAQELSCQPSRSDGDSFIPDSAEKGVKIKHEDFVLLGQEGDLRIQIIDAVADLACDLGA